MGWEKVQKRAVGEYYLFRFTPYLDSSQTSGVVLWNMPYFINVRRYWDCCNRSKPGLEIPQFDLVSGIAKLKLNPIDWFLLFFDKVRTRTNPVIVGTLRRFLLSGDYSGDTFAVGGEFEMIQVMIYIVYTWYMTSLWCYSFLHLSTSDGKAFSYYVLCWLVTLTAELQHNHCFSSHTYNWISICYCYWNYNS